MNYKKALRIVSLLVSLIIIVTTLAVPSGFAAGAGDGKGILAYGVDVSKWQGTIDWAKVKADGKSFAILRIGTTKGKDSFFEENYRKAKAAGVNVGCYFYTYATTVEEAKADADMVLSWLDGKQLEYPVYYDMEDSVQLASGMTTKLRTDMCMAFLDKMSSQKWYVGTYASGNWFSNYLDKATLGKTHELWLASWMDSKEPTRDYSSQYGLWQYTDKGKVNGISTDVDLDVAYRDYPTIMKNGGYNGFSVNITEVNEEWIITSSNGVNVRSGAGTSFEKVGYLPLNARIYVTAKIETSDYTWGKITLADVKEAWCVLDFAKQTNSTLVSVNDKITIKGNLIFGAERGTIITEDMFKVDGFAKIEMPKSIDCGTGEEVTLTLGGSTVNKYYVVIDGDINGDSYVDAIDLTISISLSNMQSSFEKASAQFHAADVNRDGTCDIYDTEIISLMTLDLK